MMGERLILLKQKQGIVYCSFYTALIVLDSASLQDAQVDLNPHQIDAALFAFKSPLSQGAILADEVGLGKTIEAGIILLSYWYVSSHTSSIKE